MLSQAFGHPMLQAGLKLSRLSNPVQSPVVARNTGAHHTLWLYVDTLDGQPEVSS